MLDDCLSDSRAKTDVERNRNVVASSTTGGTSSADRSRILCVSGARIEG